MTISIIDHNQATVWNDFVDRHPYGWLCHRYEWKEILEKSFPHIQGYYLAKWDDQHREIQAAMPIYKVSSRLTGNRLVSIPFATLSDPMIDNKEQIEEFVKFTDEIFKEKIKYTEIRTHFAGKFLKQNKDFNESRYNKNHFIQLNGDLKKLRKSFHQSVKYSINRGFRGDFEFIIGETQKDLKTFYHLYVKTRKTLGLPPQPYRFFEQLWKRLGAKKFFSINLACLGDKTVSALIIFKYKKRMSVEFLGWDRNYAKDCPNHFLYWKTIQMAQEEGCTFFDFGRTHIGNQSLMDFKNRWGTEIIDLPVFRAPKETQIQNNKDKTLPYDAIRSMSQFIPSKIFQAIGHFCYKHMG